MKSETNSQIKTGNAFDPSETGSKTLAYLVTFTDDDIALEVDPVAVRELEHGEQASLRRAALTVISRKYGIISQISVIAPGYLIVL